MSKNLQKVQDMLDGKGTGKIQSGYSTVKEHRKVGDKWTDSDGYKWEQKDGFQIKSGGSMPARGMFNHQCKDCGKNCSPKTAKPWDRDTWKADGRCYYCQIDFEAELKTGKPLRWFAYRRLKDLNNMEALEKDMEQWVEAITEERKQNPFDETVANAIANGEVEMSINKNLQ
jgi:hypothetical protein